MTTADKPFILLYLFVVHFHHLYSSVLLLFSSQYFSLVLDHFHNIYFSVLILFSSQYLSLVLVQFHNFILQHSDPIFFTISFFLNLLLLPFLKSTTSSVFYCSSTSYYLLLQYYLQYLQYHLCYIL